VSAANVPVLICRRDRARNPTNEDIADCLGFNDANRSNKDPRSGRRRGRTVRGSSCAVHAIRGPDVLASSRAPGGQAGSSSKIENYLGFPTGISGQELASRAYNQAQKFGAQIMIAKGARELACARRPYAIRIDDQLLVPARTVIIASGAAYRRLDVADLSRFEGAGVYYGATFIEAQLCRGDEVVVVGGGNSAGQAAVFLAQTARHVHMLVRAKGLAESMSRYLIRRIEDNPAI
jgi:thioredoxin reductase (NADPH)